MNTNFSFFSFSPSFYWSLSLKIMRKKERLRGIILYYRFISFSPIVSLTTCNSICSILSLLLALFPSLPRANNKKEDRIMLYLFHSFSLACSFFLSPDRKIQQSTNKGIIMLYLFHSFSLACSDRKIQQSTNKGIIMLYLFHSLSCLLSFFLSPDRKIQQSIKKKG